LVIHHHYDDSLPVQETCLHSWSITPFSAFWLCPFVSVQVSHPILWSHHRHSGLLPLLTWSYLDFMLLNLINIFLNSLWRIAEVWLFWMDELGNRWRWAQHWDAFALHCQSFWRVIHSLFKFWYSSLTDFSDAMIAIKMSQSSLFWWDRCLLKERPITDAYFPSISRTLPISSWSPLISATGVRGSVTRTMTSLAVIFTSRFNA